MPLGIGQTSEVSNDLVGVNSHASADPAVSMVSSLTAHLYFRVSGLVQPVVLGLHRLVTIPIMGNNR